MQLFPMVAILLFASTSNSLKMLITNDDSWATANIRAIYYAAKKAGHDALISAPVMQQSGVGELMREAVILEEDGEFGLIKKGAPAEGHDKNDDRIWYVNTTPIGSVKFGLEVLSLRYFGGLPDVVLSGTNQGFNLGLAYLASGTFAAAKYAISKGVPGLAFSSGNNAIRPYTELKGQEDQASIYAEMIMQLVSQLQKDIASNQSLLPSGVGLNVNFPNATRHQCTALNSSWKQTRLLGSIDRSPDACLCHQAPPCKLPSESSIERAPTDCTNSISVFEPRLFDPDASPSLQIVVNKHLQGLITCP